MKKKFFLSMMMLLAMSFTFVSCNEDDETIVVNDSQLKLEMPINVTDVVLTSFSGTMTNVLDNQTVELPQPVKAGNDYVINLPLMAQGTYKVNARGHISFLKDGLPGETDFEMNSENVTLTKASNSLKMVINSFKAEGGFVISEIFYTGTTTPEGKQYVGGDGYIVITNNSDVTLYADSIAVLESLFLTTTKQDYDPDIMATDFAVDAVYMIPGNGRDVAVEPGKSLVLGINAIDHREANPNSFDLGVADFEFFDQSANPNFTDPDNENVPNLDKWYCYTATTFGFHNRGFKSYAIAKMSTSKEDWLENYQYQANYKMVFGEYSFDMTSNGYRVPNTWVLDAVNLCVESEFQWLVTAPTLDAGWTYCGKVDRDATRYNKAVVRKKDSTGKYIDTNNSTEDFEPEAQPSLLIVTE